MAAIKLKIPEGDFNLYVTQRGTKPVFATLLSMYSAADILETFQECVRESEHVRGSALIVDDMKRMLEQLPQTAWDSPR